MPLPKPDSGESHDDFISRCMGNDTMIADYPDEDQRYAVCESQWGRNASSRKIEYRNYDLIEPLTIEFRDDSIPHFVGHAAVFDSEFDAGWMIETIARGAFKKSIKRHDIRALWNHNPDYVLGRNKAIPSPTLFLKEDERGLHVDIIPPDTQWARDHQVTIMRGDVNQMSFGFEIDDPNNPEQVEWIRGEKKNPDKRILREVHLWDVSPVTFPAYQDTDIAVRSHEAWKQLQAIPPGIASVPWKSRLYQRKLKLLGGLSNG